MKKDQVLAQRLGKPLPTEAMRKHKAYVKAINATSFNVDELEDINLYLKNERKLKINEYTLNEDYVNVSLDGLPAKLDRHVERLTRKHGQFLKKTLRAKTKEFTEKCASMDAKIKGLYRALKAAPKVGEIYVYFRHSGDITLKPGALIPIKEFTLAGVSPTYATKEGFRQCCIARLKLTNKDSFIIKDDAVLLPPSTFVVTRAYDIKSAATPLVSMRIYNLKIN